MISSDTRWTAKRKYDIAMKWERGLISETTLILMGLTREEVESWVEIASRAPSYEVAIERLKVTKNHPRELRHG